MFVNSNSNSNKNMNNNNSNNSFFQESKKKSSKTKKLSKYEDLNNNLFEGVSNINTSFDTYQNQM